MAERSGALLDLPVRELVAATRSRTVSATDVVAELAVRVADAPRALNAFITVDLDRAAARARLLDDLPLERRGALHGLPMSLKDNVPTAEFPTTYGMRTTPAPAGEDSSFAAVARAAGVIVFAKSNTPPNAYADVTHNDLIGATANPNDLARTAGGSSGGAGASVGAGIEPLAHGTDAGGSVRMPAAHCGVVGFKPSYGRLPRTPAADLWGARGHHGLLARRVDDIRVGMNALVGEDGRDPLSLSRADWDAPAPRPRRGRIAVALSLFGQDVDGAVAAVFARALDRLSDAGLPIEPIDVVWADPVPGAAAQLRALEHAVFGARLAREPELFDAGHADYIRAGASVTAAELLAAQRDRSALYTRAHTLMEGYDAVLTPTLPVTSWPLAEQHPRINRRAVEREPGSRWPDVLLANLTGWPAASIPAGTAGHLPVGLHVLSPRSRDHDCLDLAEHLHEILADPAATEFHPHYTHSHRTSAHGG